MKFKLGFASALVLVSSLTSMTSAHTFLRTLTIDGKQTEVGQCIEPYHGPDKTSGVKDSASDDITCSIPGSSPALYILGSYSAEKAVDHNTSATNNAKSVELNDESSP
ncbi:hypothetical protein BX661DRAFT_205857 [Kickxella alabastrina]|uniref:uncharacterized protein n=1 Tax=Kickxella alabastrina TaxID=61397 RepID=UPI00221E5EFA|nr:uncharacterized protein BX661DRAFT_205857 [Kickxella alabastrina]KAI7826849.1 hypothetical protein BX661DRAFT_205857 [Kickxella alabastrina]